MATTAGAPIVVDDFAAELDALGLLTATHSGQIADINTRVLLDANIGRKAHTAGDSDQLIANSGSYFSSIGVSFNTIASRVIKTSFCCRASSATAGDQVTFVLKDDDTDTVIQAGDAWIGANDALEEVSFFAITVPAAGFHTYRLYIQMSNGVGPGGYIGSGSAPALLLVEDIGEVT